ncbi:MAG: FliI/YscN family ATPase [Mycoplasma sp.]
MSSGVLQRWYNVVEMTNNVVVIETDEAFVGEFCVIRINKNKKISGEVISFKNNLATICLLDDGKGISSSTKVALTGKIRSIDITPSILGSVIDANFNVITRFGPSEQLFINTPQSYREVSSDGVSPLIRSVIDEKCITGIKAIDSLLTVGVGQRIGIFAPAGTGKTTLLVSLLNGIKSDIYILILVGERGREVNEFISFLIPDDIKNKCIVVYSTSDQSSILRRNAALIGMTISEYFRDAGFNVLVLFDSITRYARALREIALDSGEKSNDKYPSSVYSNIPRILERAGKTKNGSITAFYTILLESEDDDDPLGNEVKSIIDGHFYLTNKLSSKNHYPAIDVLSSKSRLFESLVSDDFKRDATLIRNALSKYQELEFLIDIGEYKSGVNRKNDKVVENIDEINSFLTQANDEFFSENELNEKMQSITSKLT